MFNWSLPDPFHASNSRPPCEAIAGDVSLVSVRMIFCSVPSTPSMPISVVPCTRATLRLSLPEPFHAANIAPLWKASAGAADVASSSTVLRSAGRILAPAAKLRTTPSLTPRVW